MPSSEHFCPGNSLSAYAPAVEQLLCCAALVTQMGRMGRRGLMKWFVAARNCKLPRTGFVIFEFREPDLVELSLSLERSSDATLPSPRQCPGFGVSANFERPVPIKHREQLANCPDTAKLPSRNCSRPLDECFLYARTATAVDNSISALVAQLDRASVYGTEG